MTSIIQFLKNNPIVTAAIFVVIISLVVLFLLVHQPGKAFVEDVKGRKAEENTINALMTESVPIPGATPEEPYRTVSITPNEKNIEKLTQVHEQIRRQYTQIFDKAATFNRDGIIIETDASGKETGRRRDGTPHEPMLDGLFPRAEDQGKLYDARDAYRSALRRFLDRPTEIDDQAMRARLNAAPPPTADQIDEARTKVEAGFLSQFIPRRSRDQLEPAELKKLVEQETAEVMGLLKTHAERIGIYAETDIKSADFPFEIPFWVDETDQPRIADLWEGQMTLWVTQDIVRAIQLANEQVTESHNGRSVITAPVKRLVSIEVVDGYIGVTARSGVGSLTIRSRRDDAEAAGARPPQRTNRDRQAPTIDYHEIERTRQLAQNAERVADLESQDPDQKLPEAFESSMSGRISNVLYDVRHARVELIVDYQQLPLLFKKLSQVNFMTVLEMGMADVDEYEALRSGYVYGPGDSVRVALLVESIWLRKWVVGDAESLKKWQAPSFRDLGDQEQQDIIKAAGLMPMEVREQLGIVALGAPATTP